MATHITVPVTGISDVVCHGGAVLTPDSVIIRYSRRDQPRVTVTGPTRYADAGESEEGAFNFGFCTCRKWLAAIVEHHRPAGYRTWDHGEASAWEVICGRWINTEEAPDPHRDPAAAIKAALADVGDCEVLRHVLTQALAAQGGP
ncbi:hypothetical protein [Streptomyces sp. ECR3.8]|uniref:hypothetical protein n=1 Tax=Streptomyces sp. ECR3.8 TaxID=3461009 RepID=UPI0040422FE3